jgi:hypothetical protein
MILKAGQFMQFSEFENLNKKSAFFNLLNDSYVIKIKELNETFVSVEREVIDFKDFLIWVLSEEFIKDWRSGCKQESMTVDVNEACAVCWTLCEPESNVTEVRLDEVLCKVISKSIREVLNDTNVMNSS